MKPLFMWAGGKSKMLKHYQAHLPQTFNTYIEPFFGGGAMFIAAQSINPNAKFVINDVNAEIIGIYQAIKTDCDKFIQKMDELSDEYLPLSKEDKIGRAHV